MDNSSQKLLFSLDVQDDWPPIASEAVWCERVGTAYKLLNTPLFIKGLAVNDIFSAEPDATNGHIFQFEVLEPSSHSLVWILDNSTTQVNALLGEFRAIGCSTVSLEKFSMHAVDIPPQINNSSLDALFDAADNMGMELAFPVWRHE
jgi:Domain of unknown function (DUF4265)